MDSQTNGEYPWSQSLAGRVSRLDGMADLTVERLNRLESHPVQICHEHGDTMSRMGRMEACMEQVLDRLARIEKKLDTLMEERAAEKERWKALTVAISAVVSACMLGVQALVNWWVK